MEVGKADKYRGSKIVITVERCDARHVILTSFLRQCFDVFLIIIYSRDNWPR